jgi:hypothetical protein
MLIRHEASFPGIITGEDQNHVQTGRTLVAAFAQTVVADNPGLINEQEETLKFKKSMTKQVRRCGRISMFMPAISDDPTAQTSDDTAELNKPKELDRKRPSLKTTIARESLEHISKSLEEGFQDYTETSKAEIYSRLKSYI